MKWVGLIVPLILTGLACWQVPIGVWIDMNQGLLAFLGLLAAALIQVIPVTANFLQSDRLTPEEAIRLSGQLLKQQRYWFGLLISSIVTFAVVVVVSVLKERTEWSLGRFGTYDVGPAFSGLVTFFLSFVLLKMTAIVSGVMSLQNLRNELVLAAARRAAAEQIVNFQQAQEESGAVASPVVPPGYGSIIRPH